MRRDLFYLVASSTFIIGQILDSHSWLYHPRLHEINEFMSTRSGRRRHPYRRVRHVGSTAGGSAVGHTRRRRQPAATQTTMDAELDPGGCIDLTANDTLDEDVIDLTASSSSSGRGLNAMDSPVVVLSPVDVDNADSFSRVVTPRQVLWGAERAAGDDVIDLEREASPEGSSARVTRSSSTIDIDSLSDDDDDNDDLPAAPFSQAEQSSILSSPAGTRITCPVCMDSDAQIRRDGRQLYSTTCGHIFCSVCIKQSVSTQHRCPTCRKRLTGKQIHPLFL